MDQTKQGTSSYAIVTRGKANEILIFEPGRGGPPFSVGSHGDWRIIAPGVAPLHFYLCFDGQALFARLVARVPGAGLDGKPLSTTWTELPPVCELTVGQARIAITNPGAHGTALPPTKPRLADPRGPRITDPFARETIVESIRSPLASAAETRVDDPLEAPTMVMRRSKLETLGVHLGRESALELPTLIRRPYEVAARTPTTWEGPASEPLPSTKPVGLRGGPAIAETIIRPVGSPAAAALAAPSPPARTRVGAKLASATESSRRLVRPAIAGLMMTVLGLLGVRTLVKRGNSQDSRAAVAAAVSSTRARPAVASAPRAQPAPSAQPAPTAPADLERDRGPLPMVDGKTPERQAVDLVARGAYADAATLYDHLARRTDSPTFRQAARIARRKARLP